MKLKQLSLFLENKPGALIAPVKLLAAANINILTLTIAEARQFGILRLLVSDWQEAKDLLEKNDLLVKATDVLAIEVADRPVLWRRSSRSSKKPASTWNTCTPSPSSARPGDCSSSAWTTRTRPFARCEKTRSAWSETPNSSSVWKADKPAHFHGSEPLPISEQDSHGKSQTAASKRPVCRTMRH